MLIQEYKRCFKIAWIAFFVGSLLFAASRAPGADVNNDSLSLQVLAWHNELFRETSCGPISLYTIMKYMGLTCSTDQERKLLDTNRRKGISIRELEEMAKQCGLYTAPVSISVAKLKELGLYAVANFEGYRYVAVTGYTPKGVEVVAPLESPVLMSDDEFSRYFGEKGYALLLSSSPLPSSLTTTGKAKTKMTNGPVCSPAQSVLAVGQVVGGQWNEKLQIRNDGNQPLKISQIIPSCPCMNPELDKSTILPGDSALLTVEGHEAEVGLFDRFLIVKSNCSVHSDLKIQVRGVIEPAIFLGRSFVEIRPETAATPADFEVPFWLSRGYEGASVDARVEDQTLPIKVDVNVNGERGNLHIHWLGTKTTGWMRTRVVLQPKGEGPVAVSFHLVAFVPSIGKLFPSSVVFKDEGQNQFCRSIQINTKEPFTTIPQLRWGDSQMGKAFTSSFEKVNDNTMILKLSIAKDQLTHLLPCSSDLAVICGQGRELTARVQVGVPEWK